MMIIRPQTRVRYFYPGMRHIAPKVSAIPWWLTGGIPAANCIAAYQAKGAASYAASKINLANPGTYNATDGVAYPTWNTSTGWSFVAASLQYLITGVAPASGWSAIIRIANYTKTNGVFAFGGYNTTDSQGMAINPSRADSRPVFYNGGGETPASGGLTAGVFAVAGQYGYINGSSVTGALAAWITTISNICIGCYYREGVGAQTSTCITGGVIAFAIYNTNIAAYISGLTTAMAAL